MRYAQFYDFIFWKSFLYNSSGIPPIGLSQLSFWYYPIAIILFGVKGVKISDFNIFEQILKVGVSLERVGVASKFLVIWICLLEYYQFGSYSCWINLRLCRTYLNSFNRFSPLILQGFHQLNWAQWQLSNTRQDLSNDTHIVWG
jgi:hypothetical protein